MIPAGSLSESSAPDQAKLRTGAVDVIIPAWNEQDSIGRVIEEIPRDRVRRIIVADNNSTDATADVARRCGAIVIPAARQGYGSACLAGIGHLTALEIEEQPEVVAFIDADYSDYPQQLGLLIDPILRGEADFVIGSRMLKPQPRGAMLPQAVFGNKLACFLTRLLFGQRYTDLGPFRAISWRALQDLHMCDPNYGWTMEMQIKAARRRLRILEVPVDYRPRIGRSKITGTVRGTISAGIKILLTIARYGIMSNSQGAPAVPIDDLKKSGARG